MKKPIDFYIAEKEKFIVILSSLKKRLSILSLLRLSVFLLTVFGIYFFFGKLNLVIPVLLSGIILFAFLVSKHNDLLYKKNKTLKLIGINQLEIDVINGDLSRLDKGKEFLDPEHYFSYDIDLFGEGSFFQFINRTATKNGKQKLADTLTGNDIDHITEKQEAVKELSQKPEWRQDYVATAEMIRVDTDSESILKWMKKYKSFVPTSFSFIPTVFSVLSLLSFIALSLELIPFSVVLLWFFVGLTIIFFYIKKINHLYEKANKVKGNFNQYHKLLDLIEKQEFTAKNLITRQNEIRSEKEKASVIFKKFSKILDAFDQRNNMIFGILGNGFLLWDLQQSYKIEEWLRKYHDKVEHWFDVIAYFDAQNSLANYVFNHPEYTFPEITNKEKVIDSKKLGHPLIDPEQRIDNDFDIAEKEFFIITGANMAGKSTFLRTVSLSIVMSNIGLPVCSEKFVYHPIKLITSMRTSDSLSKDESYFFSELKRLKFIVDEISKDRYFIVLDEILKGTNSKDKAIGSKKFVMRLVNSGSTGIIATHDLSLCEIEKDFTQIRNKYFDAEIVNDELLFDYRLKQGICKNMNASFLLKKMKIV
ncbi:MAG: DNA mismatch repair protein MutS [Flavobacteriia bacterium]|nr:MAG: DNA mismatch repair protein MutS [Flavobacteriia bacterium]